MKQIILYLLIFWGVSLSFAQSSWEYLNTTGDQSNFLSAFYETPAGNIVMAYNVDEGNDINESYLLWLDQDGEEISRHGIDKGAANNLLIIEIYPSGDGNFYLLGERELEDRQELMFLKVSPQASILEEHYYEEPGNHLIGSKVLRKGSSFFFYGNYIDIDQDTSVVPSFLMKINTTGDSLWTINPFAPQLLGPIWLTGAITAEGELVFFGMNDNVAITKVDLDGNIIEQTSFDNASADWDNVRVNRLIAHPDGGFGFLGFEQRNTNDYYREAFYKLGPDFLLEWKIVSDSIFHEVGTPRDFSISTTLDEANNFQVISLVYALYDSTGLDDFSVRRFRKITPEGEVLLDVEQDMNLRRLSIRDLERLNNGGYVYSGREAGQTLGGITIPTYSYIKTLSADGTGLTNLVEGNVFYDSDLDCEKQVSELGLWAWLIEASNEQSIHYAWTDSLGNYRMSLGVDTFNIKIFPPVDYWDFCDSEEEVVFTTGYDTTMVDFAAQVETECPGMWVNISTDRLRRCFENTYYVNYCNYGTVNVADSYIEITLPDELAMLDAEIDFYYRPDSTVVFELDSVAINECGTFTFTVLVDCAETELDQTLCTEAHIFPDTLCNIDPLWSGASIDVFGECVNEDSLLFTIYNFGAAPTSMPLQYIVVEDQVIMMQEQFELSANDSLKVSIAATGATFRMEAEQEPLHPGNSQPSFSIEGCGGFTPGMINLFPMNDADPFVDIDCQQVLGAFDPNDKTGFPLGYEEENFIEKNTDIEYLIRFQNTGNDTAFRVVIRDTLSAFLDPVSVIPGGSSHDYRYELLENGVLKFTFDNILLPDSTTNYEGSNGFVEFKIRQQTDNPIGTEIHNTAAIYFDFNEPIITNQTTHTIGMAMVLDIVNDGFKKTGRLIAFPNPFVEEVHFKIENQTFKKGRLDLFNIRGQLIRSINFDQPEFSLLRNNLPSGVYSFTIHLDAQRTFAGKLVIPKT